MPGRTFAIGDIHGCDVAFDVLLDHLAVTADDTLVVLGDVVDRGPNTRRVVERLLELRGRCRLEFLLGNHEEMFLDAYQGSARMVAWLEFGGRAALASYGGDFANVPAEHIDFLRSGRDYLETDTDIYIHATLEPGVPLADQSPQFLRWNKLTGLEPPHPSGKRVICGHTPVASGVPLAFPGWVDLDTWAYNGLFLTALNVETNEVFQSQQSGTFRGGLTLDELL